MAKVLIIDDDKMVRRILRQIIKYEGFEVEEAKDGAEGLNMIMTNDYEIIFCDVQMPKMDGIEMVEKVKALNILAPVVMLSVQSDTVTIMETIKKGASDFIGKPIKTHRFLEVLRKHIN